MNSILIHLILCSLLIISPVTVIFVIQLSAPSKNPTNTSIKVQPSDKRNSSIKLPVRRSENPSVTEVHRSFGFAIKLYKKIVPKYQLLFEC